MLLNFSSLVAARGGGAGHLAEDRVPYLEPLCGNPMDFFGLELYPLKHLNFGLKFPTLRKLGEMSSLH